MAYGWSIDRRARCHQRSAISHDMVRLCVNVNKVATLRNSRGGREPSVLEAVEVCLAAGAPGITVHPRADRRHITPDDVRDDRARAARTAPRDRVQHRRRSAARAARSGRGGAAGSVHARAGRAGRGHQPGRLAAGAGRPSGCRRSIAAPARGRRPRQPVRRRRRPMPIRWAASVGADRVELYTEPFARAFEQGADAGRAVVRAVCRGGRARARARPRRQRRPRSRSRQPRRSSATCRISTRSRSATPSSRARCSSASSTVVARVSAAVSAGRAALRYDRTIFDTMKSDAIAFGIAGILFGLIAGWIIGAQQAAARPPAPRAGRAAGVRRRAAAPPRAPRCSTRPR